MRAIISRALFACLHFALGRDATCAAGAMARAVPVIATDVVGNKDAVGHGESGWLYSPGSPQTAARRLAQLADNRPQWAAMANARAACGKRIFRSPDGGEHVFGSTRGSTSRSVPPGLPATGPRISSRSRTRGEGRPRIALFSLRKRNPQPSPNHHPSENHHAISRGRSPLARSRAGAGARCRDAGRGRPPRPMTRPCRCFPVTGIRSRRSRRATHQLAPPTTPEEEQQFEHKLLRHRLLGSIPRRPARRQQAVRGNSTCTPRGQHLRRQHLHHSPPASNPTLSPAVTGAAASRPVGNYTAKSESYFHRRLHRHW